MMGTTNTINENHFKSLIVLGRFADAFRGQTHLNKTQLHLQSRLRWDLYKKYLDWLLQRGFVKYDVINNVEHYSLTQNGEKMFNILGIFLGIVLR